jgi:hypothetical protein
MAENQMGKTPNLFALLVGVNNVWLLFFPPDFDSKYSHVLFGPTTLLTEMTGISLHMQWTLTYLVI